MNLILFTPRIVKYDTINIALLNIIKKKNIRINITDMAKYPNNTIDVIHQYLEFGIDPNKLACHISSKSREKKDTDKFLYFLKDHKINNILCVSGDITGVVNNIRSDAYSVYDLIELTKNDFKISLSAYPENNIYSNKYCAIHHHYVINKKIKILADCGYSNVDIFFQHSYSYDCVKNMSRIVKNIGLKYYIDTNVIPSVLPLFNPKYVFNVSGDKPVNNNSVDIPIQHLDLLHNAKLSDENTLTNKQLLYDETIKIIHLFRTINHGNISIYNTNNTDLMIKLIHGLPENE